jgi:hypothetical protein
MGLLKQGVFVMILITFLAMGIGSVSAAVPNPANGHFYELVNAAGIDWSAARAAASEMTQGGPLCSGHLATVTSQEENNFIVSAFTAGALSNKWIGGFQDGANSSTVNDGWQWVTGEPWSYTNWNSGEPSNHHHTQGYEDAVTFWADSGNWNDAPSEWQYWNGGYVVEYDCRQVIVDIKPGSAPNSINLKSKGVVPVAILTTEDFDAADVNAGTVTLAGIAPAKWEMLDVPEIWDTVLMMYVGDGDLDMVLYFSTRDLATVLDSSSTMTTLEGATSEGGHILGTDTLRILRA